MLAAKKQQKKTNNENNNDKNTIQQPVVKRELARGLSARQQSCMKSLIRM